MKSGTTSTATPVYAEQEVSFQRRFLADELLEIALFVITIGIGWYVWLLFTSRRGRTPAKDFAGVTIHDYNTGEVASMRKVWIREVGGKVVFPAAISTFVSFAFGPAFGSTFFAAYHVTGALSPIVLEERRAIWDHIAGTVVRYHLEPS
ncbi:MAG TPA: RDD family protein [Dehalococcoidia bacterium]|nr:RDD family protein [Dehalococcoidia bacterium]